MALAKLGLAQSAPDGADYHRFRLLGLTTGSGTEPIYYSQNGQDIPVTFNNETRSDFYKYIGPQIFDFYTIKNDSNGNPQHLPAAHIDITKAGKWPLIVVFPTSAPLLYSTIAIADDLGALPPGSIELVNFTPSNSVLKVASKVFTIPANSSDVTKERPTPPRTTLYVECTCDSKILYGNNWAFYPNMRTILFLFPNPRGTGSPSVKRLVESSSFPPDKDDPSNPIQ